VFESMQEEQLETLTLGALQIYKGCNLEVPGYKQFKEFLQDWATSKDDVYFTVTESPNPRKKTRSQFTLTTTGVTDMTLIVRHQGKPVPYIKTLWERLQAEREAEEEQRHQKEEAELLAKYQTASYQEKQVMFEPEWKRRIELEDAQRQVREKLGDLNQECYGKNFRYDVYESPEWNARFKAAVAELESVQAELVPFREAEKLAHAKRSQLEAKLRELEQ